MSRVQTTGLIFQTENMDIPHKGIAAKNMISNISKTGQKGGKGRIGNRKALQDISNSSAIQNNASIKKKNTTKEKQNVGDDEMFLHDHRKCLEAQKAGMDKELFDAFLFEHGLLFPAPSSPKLAKPEAGVAMPPRILELEPVPELPLLDVADWSISLIQWDSPPVSPRLYDLPELVLKLE